MKNKTVEKRSLLKIQIPSSIFRIKSMKSSENNNFFTKSLKKNNYFSKSKSSEKNFCHSKFYNIFSPVLNKEIRFVKLKNKINSKKNLKLLIKSKKKKNNKKLKRFSG